MPSLMGKEDEMLKYGNNEQMAMCEQCGCLEPIEEMHEVNGCLYCNDCMDEAVVCDVCGDIFWLDDGGAWIEGEEACVCDRCLASDYVYSNIQDRYIRYYDAVEVYNDFDEVVDYINYHVEGYEDEVGYCDGCNRFYLIDFITYTDSGCFCNDCNPQGILQPYHSGERFQPQGIDGKKLPFDGGRYIGFEMEFCFVDGKNWEMLELMNDCLPAETLTFEEDCTVDFEVITCPMTIDRFYQLLPAFQKMVNIAEEHGATMMTNASGMHVHFSRAWWRSTKALNYTLLAYRMHRNIFDRLSGRTYFEWCNNNLDRCSFSSILNNENGRLCCGHGEAINCGNSMTIEFRQFAGCKNMEDFAVWVELHVGLINLSNRFILKNEAVRTISDFRNIIGSVSDLYQLDIALKIQDKPMVFEYIKQVLTLKSNESNVKVFQYSNRDELMEGIKKLGGIEKLMRLYRDINISEKNIVLDEV